MTLDVKFEEQSQTFSVDFGEVQTALDGGFERGYQQGYDNGHSVGLTQGREEGYNEGHSDGYAQGLSERRYETWTITLVDGTVVEKEVALL